MIDKKYYQANQLIYFGDWAISSALFALFFILALRADGPMVALYGVLSSIALYRAGAFVHELAHQSKSGQLDLFERAWNLTLGPVVLVPAVRFFHPHLTHHKVGTFGTKADPQYMPIRTDKKLAAFVLLAIPPIMPIFNLLLVIAASLGERLDVEGAIERYLARKGYTVGTSVLPEQKREVVLYSRYYLVVFLLYVWFFAYTLPLMYAIQVGTWWMITLRIPLEHEMREFRETTGERDHLVDSFTVESPFAEILQPLCLRLHTAHHMYPGVPYHNLPALHRELKRTNEEYRKSVVSFMTAVRGPVRTDALQ